MPSEHANCLYPNHFFTPQPPPCSPPTLAPSPLSPCSLHLLCVSFWAVTQPAVTFIRWSSVWAAPASAALLHPALDLLPGAAATCPAVQGSTLISLPQEPSGQCTTALHCSVSRHFISSSPSLSFMAPVPNEKKGEENKVLLSPGDGRGDKGEQTSSNHT